MLQESVVYNPASVTSVLAAAYYMQHRRNSWNATKDSNNLNLKAFIPGSKVPKDSGFTIWVGVTPSIETLNKMQGSHIAYTQCEIKSKKGNKDREDIVIRTFSNADVCKSEKTNSWKECIEAIDDSSFKAMLAHNYILVIDDENNQMARTPQLYVAQLAVDFEYGKDMPFNDQALVWYNYTHGLKYLTGAETEYVFKGYSTKFDNPNYSENSHDVCFANYRYALRNIKQQLSTIFETVTFIIDGVNVSVPFLNVDQTVSPLMLRVISKSYDYAITYVQRKGINIYSAFSRIAGFDEVLLKTVNSGNQKPSGMMSYQL